MPLKLRLRISLRMLLAFMVVVAIGLGVYVRLKSGADEQREIVAELQKTGGRVRYDFECWNESRWYSAQRWLAPRTGPDLVGNVLILNFDDRVTEPAWTEVLPKVRRLQTIEYLSVPRPDLTTDQVRQLAQVRGVKQLGLHRARELPDLAPLVICRELESLSLHSCRNVTAEKLRTLRHLPKLKLMDFCVTDADDEVARELVRFAALKEVHVEFSQITQQGIQSLLQSSSLKIVHLSRVQNSQEFARLAPGVKFDVK